MKSIQYNLFNLKRELEIKTQRQYTWVQIADGASIHRNTVLNMANNRTRRIDLDIMLRLIAFFAKEGMPISISDLFLISG